RATGRETVCLIGAAETSTTRAVFGGAGDAFEIARPAVATALRDALGDLGHTRMQRWECCHRRAPDAAFMVIMGTRIRWADERCVRARWRWARGMMSSRVQHRARDAFPRLRCAAPETRLAPARRVST